MIPILGRFGRDAKGSVALIFALAAIALVGLIGAALDYSRAASIQSNLQRAVDGAALLAAKEFERLTATLLAEDAATEFVRKTFSTERINDMKVKVTFLGDRARVEANATVPTTITNVIGIRTMPISGISEAMYAQKAEIILVLDNTGSMNDGNKLPTLKAAANAFLDKMKTAASTPDGVRIGIVPFETDVNLGSYKNASWVDPAQTAYWTSKPETSGCIWDREQPNDAKDTLPSPGAPSTLYGADQTRATPCSIGPIVPLTSDFDALHASINGMVASGTTNLTIGLVWGLHLLTPSEPITNALPFGTRNLKKYLILMTDGKNTKSRGTDVVTSMDARTRQACDAAKAFDPVTNIAQITVFTVRIIDGNDALLSDCASKPPPSEPEAKRFFAVNDVTQLDPVFTEIHRAITLSRISR